MGCFHSKSNLEPIVEISTARTDNFKIIPEKTYFNEKPNVPCQQNCQEYVSQKQSEQVLNYSPIAYHSKKESEMFQGNSIAYADQKQSGIINQNHFRIQSEETNQGTEYVTEEILPVEYDFTMHCRQILAIINDMRMSPSGYINIVSQLISRIDQNKLLVFENGVQIQLPEEINPTDALAFLQQA